MDDVDSNRTDRRGGIPEIISDPKARGQLTPNNFPTQAKTRLEWATRPSRRDGCELLSAVPTGRDFVRMPYPALRAGLLSTVPSGLNAELAGSRAETKGPMILFGLRTGFKARRILIYGTVENHRGFHHLG